MDPKTEEETEATPLLDSVEDVTVDPDDGAEKIEEEGEPFHGNFA